MRRPFNEPYADGQFVLHGLVCLLRTDFTGTVELKQQAARSHETDKVVHGALALAHTHFKWFPGHRDVGKSPENDLGFTCRAVARVTYVSHCIRRCSVWLGACGASGVQVVHCAMQRQHSFPF